MTILKNTDAWKIKQAPYLQYKTKGKITASMKSETGEGLLYRQLLPTLKRGIPGFQKNMPWQYKSNEEIFENHH